MATMFSYSSIHAYITDIQHISPINRKAWERYQNGIRSGNYARNWFGPFGTDWDAAFAAIEGNWPDGAALVERMAQGLEDKVPMPESIRRRIRRADQGDMLDIQDVYCGRLSTAWRIARRDHKAQGSQEIWIGHYSGMRGDDSGNILQWRGAAVAALCNILTTAGYSVGILLYNGHHNAHDAIPNHNIEVDVKTPLDPLNINSLVSSIVNPGFHRILYFQWCCSRDVRASSGFGQAYDYVPAREGIITGTMDITNEHSARQWIVRALSKLNAEE